MAKKLTLKSEDQQLFDMIHGGFHACAMPATREEHKHATRILEALESISTETPAPMFPKNPDGPKARTINAGGGACFFEDQEFGYLKKILGSIQTAPQSSRRVLEMWERLDAVEDGRMIDFIKVAG